MPQDSYRSRPREEDDGPRLNVVAGAKSDKEARGLKRKDYEDSLRELHVKLVELQEWVRHKGKKVCIVFEGRDGAGKGGAIKAITARVSPRVFRVVALPAPTEREKSQMYIQRYLPHLPSGEKSSYSTAAGTTAPAWNASWASAAIKTPSAFSASCRRSRRRSSISGIVLLKYWLEVSPGEQEKRLKDRIDDGRKVWKLSKMDLKSFTRWDDYTRARDEMFMATDTAWAPWFVARSDDKRRARLNIIEHLLANVPYEDVPRSKIKLPKRHTKAADRASRLPLKIIPELH